MLALYNKIMVTQFMSSVATRPHSLSTDHCGLPAEGAVFGGGAGHPDSEGCWQPHPHYHMALQWEEGEG